MASDCQKSHLQGPKFLTFYRGGCPWPFLQKTSFGVPYLKPPFSKILYLLQVLLCLVAAFWRLLGNFTLLLEHIKNSVNSAHCAV